MGVNIKREYLNYVRSADDIVLISESSDELEVMLNDFNRENIKISLKMNRSKTKLTFN